MKVFYSPEARADLVEIGGYIALDSERQAEALVASLRQKAQQVASAPRISRAWDELSPGLRSAVFGNYVLLFRIADDGIEVVHIFNGARELKRLFEG